MDWICPRLKLKAAEDARVQQLAEPSLCSLSKPIQRDSSVSLPTRPAKQEPQPLPPAKVGPVQHKKRGPGDGLSH